MTRLKTAFLGSTAILLAAGMTPAIAQDNSGQVQIGGGMVAQLPGGVQGGAQGSVQGQARGGAQGGAQGDAQGGASGSTQLPGGGQGGAQGQAQGDASGQQGSAQTEGEAQGAAQARGETGGPDQDREGRRAGRGDGDRDRDGRQARRGDGDGDGTRAEFSSEHKAKVQTYFRKNKVDAAPVEVDVSISIGATVPSHIAFHPLPASVFVGLPHEHDYVYFVHGNNIVIVDADTYVIVEIIYGVA